MSRAKCRDCHRWMNDEMTKKTTLLRSSINREKCCDCAEKDRMQHEQENLNTFKTIRLEISVYAIGEVLREFQLGEMLGGGFDLYPSQRIIRRILQAICKKQDDVKIVASEEKAS